MAISFVIGLHPLLSTLYKSLPCDFFNFDYTFVSQTLSAMKTFPFGPPPPIEYRLWESAVIHIGDMSSPTELGSG